MRSGTRGRRAPAEQLGARPSADASREPWACLELSEGCATGMRRRLLIRRDAEDPDGHRSFLLSGPAETAVAELVRVCTTRRRSEGCLAEAKGEVGPDQ